MRERDHKTVRLRIRGRVQGVWYRGWMVDTGRELGLDGWVRNRLDGSVEAVASGPADAVDRLIGAAGQGPPAARVAAVEVTREPGGVAPGFRQLATA